MAHFARIDSNNVVVDILVVPDEQQHRGNDYLSNDLQLGGTWIQTSYNGNIRKIYAGIGYWYLPELDIFLPPKPYNSWSLDTVNQIWIAPIECPEQEEGKVHIWDEENQLWKTEILPVPDVDNLPPPMFP